MNGIQKVIKYCAMAFAIFLTVVIFGSIVSVVLGVTTGIAGVNFLMGEDKERIDLAQEYTLEEAHSLGIQSVLVDCNAEITVKQGEKLAIEASNVTDEYEIRCANGKFSIVQDAPGIQVKWLFVFNDATERETVVVTIPEAFQPEQVKVNSGSGKVVLEAFQTDTLMIDSGSGNVAVSDVETKRIDIDSGSGRVTLRNTNAEETGLITGSGGISVEDAVLGILRLDSGSGSVTMRNVIAEKAKVDSGSGSVLVEGTLTGTCEFETGSGSLNLRLDGNEEDYLVKAECGSGTFRINGKKREDGSYGNDVAGKLVIDSGSGSVNVEFNTPEEE